MKYFILCVWLVLAVISPAQKRVRPAKVTLQSITVAPASAAIAVSSSQQFTATANYSNGTHTVVTLSSAWSSSNTSVATVGASTGLATGIAAGSATITASYSGKTGSAALTVTATTSIRFVQVNYATPQSAQTVSIPFNSAQSAGNLNVIIVGWNDSSSQVVSVADSAGNSYAVAVGPTIGTALSQVIFYAPNIVGGSNTITVQFNQSVFAADVRILEYAGVNSFDVGSGASGNSSTASSGSFTTNFATELIVGGNMTVNTTTGAGSGFTSRVITSPDSDIAEDRTVTSIGTYSATAATTSGFWVMQAASFYAASGPPPPPPPVGITILPTSVSLLTGQQQQFTASVTNCGTNCGVNWSEQGNGAVSASGLYSAPGAAETDTVTATAQADTSKSATATVAVSAQCNPHSVGLSWIDSDPVTFNVYRSATSGGPYSSIVIGLSSTSDIDTSTPAGTYYYVVTAVDNTGIESAYSAQASAVVPCQ